MSLSGIYAAIGPAGGVLALAACVGLFLALSVPAVAWIQDSAMLLLVGALLAIVAGGLFWWLLRRESRTP